MAWYGQRRWAEQEDVILRLNYSRLTISELMVLLPNRSSQAIKSRASKFKIKKDKVEYGGWHQNFDLNLLLTYGNRQEVADVLAKDDNKSAWLSKRFYKINDYFFETPTMENCYWAGFIAADGTINPNGVQIALQMLDGHHLETFKEIINWSGNVEYKKKINKARMDITGIPLWLYDLNTHFNIRPFKSFTLKPPNLTKREHILSYIVGYIDGDGSIFIAKNNWGYYMTLQISGTQEILEWMYPYLVSCIPDLNGHKKSKPHKSNGYPSLSFNGKRALSIVSYLRGFYAGPKLERKWNKFDEFQDLDVKKKITL